MLVPLPHLGRVSREFWAPRNSSNQYKFANTFIKYAPESSNLILLSPKIFSLPPTFTTTTSHLSLPATGGGKCEAGKEATQHRHNYMTHILEYKI